MRSVIYSASRNLYPYLPVAYNSLLAHTKVDKVYILAEDDVLPYEVPSVVEVINTSGQTIFPAWGPNYSTMFTHMALIRGAYCDIIPDDMVLQLDVDTIVVDDISDVWSTDMTDSYISACHEVYGDYRPYGDYYYNIGVCLFNLKFMREHGIDKQLISLLNSQRLLYIEQDALNQLCAGHIHPMSAIYNASRFTGEPCGSRIIHFAGVQDWWYCSRYQYLKEPYEGLC